MTQKATEPRIPTSIKIKPSVWKEAKIEAIHNDVQLSDLVEQSLSAWMEILNSKDKGEKFLLNIIKKRLGTENDSS